MQSALRCGIPFHHFAPPREEHDQPPRVESARGSPFHVRTQNQGEDSMLKKLMITTALTGLMIGGALAEGTPSTSDRPASPPAATTSPASPMKDQSVGSTTGSASSVQVISTQKPDQWLASK